MTSQRTSSVARLGLWCYRRRALTVVTWIAVLAGLLTISSMVGSDYAEDLEIPESGSRSGVEILERHFGGLGAGFTGSIVFRAEQGVEDPAVVGAMQQMFAAAGQIEGIIVRGPYEGLGGGVSDDGAIAYAEVQISPELTFGEQAAAGEQIISLIPKIDGLRVEVGGEALSPFETPQSELIGVAFAIFVLILAFGSVLAMGLPIAVAVAGVAGGAGLVGLASNGTTVPEFALTVSIMIGLGVGIDYALFIVTRYRERLRAGDAPPEALGRALATSGRAVVFAGSTVIVSLLGMVLIGLGFISGMAIAAVTAVFMTMIAAATLLPALISFVGDRIEVTRWRGLVASSLVAIALIGLGLGVSALLVGAPLAAVVLLAGWAVAPLRREVARPPARPLHETRAYRLSRVVQRRAWPVAIGTSLLLVGLALPLVGLRLGFGDEGNFPEDTTTRRAYDLLAEGFGPGFNGPLLVAGEGPAEDLPAVLALLEAIGATPGVASVSGPLPNDLLNPTAVLLRVIPATAPQDEATYDLVERLRDDVIPQAVGGSPLVPYVTGSVAVAIDFTDYLAERTWFFLGAVLALSFLLLMVVFRSVLIPLKAVVMNLLSISAAYGVVIAIFQWGWLGPVTGLEPAPIEPFVPMMMFAIVFGLSMDYEVFLLTRMREEYQRTGDPTGSVADGLAATARVITAAAAIMVVVFGAFLLEDTRVIKMFGVGLGFAVLVDASIVRMLLVPATMELLGSRNWWIPRWLDRVLPHVAVEVVEHRPPLPQPVRSYFWAVACRLIGHEDVWADREHGPGAVECLMCGRVASLEPRR
jgi:RND superfamily putative drug exporter